MICDISDRQPRGNYTKPRIESSKLLQKRLEGRFTESSFLGTRRILERLQAIQNQQGSTMRDQLRQSFALLPRRSDPWIGISKPIKSSVKKFICGGGAPTATLPVEGPAKNQLSRTIMLRCHSPEPMVDQRGLSNPSPGNYRDDIYIRICPCIILGKQYPPLDQKDRFR